MTASLQAPADGWVDLDERQVWEIQRREAVRELERRKAEAAEEREYLSRQAERQAERDAQVVTRQMTGQPVDSVADVLARWRNAPDEPPPRDRTAEYGSADNPVTYVDGIEMRPAARRSDAARAALLARAKRPDPFMANQVRMLERRQAVSRPEVSRSVPSRYADTRQFDKPSVCEDCGHISCHCYRWTDAGPVRELQPGPCYSEAVRARCPRCQGNGHARRASGIGWPELVRETATTFSVS